MPALHLLGERPKGLREGRRAKSKPNGIAARTCIPSPEQPAFKQPLGGLTCRRRGRGCNPGGPRCPRTTGASIYHSQLRDETQGSGPNQARSCGHRQKRRAAGPGHSNQLAEPRRPRARPPARAAPPNSPGARRREDGAEPSRAASRRATPGGHKARTDAARPGRKLPEAPPGGHP